MEIPACPSGTSCKHASISYPQTSMNLVRLTFLLAMLAKLPAMAQTPLQTVPHVDLNRYLGKWYELARLPNRFEKKCDRDITAEYARDGEKISVRNTCTQTDGKPNIANGKAKVVDTATNAKLKVTFFWPFYGDYWVIGLDNDYRWAIVGEPGRKYLWVLSRTTTLPEGTLQQIRKEIQAAGYQPDDLIYPKQTGAR